VVREGQMMAVLTSIADQFAMMTSFQVGSDVVEVIWRA
jgi:hypothetical protein